MRKIFLLANLCLASGLSAPRILFAESGLIFDQTQGTLTGQLNVTSNIAAAGSVTASSATLTNTAGAGLSVNSSAYLAISGGNVGIGTTSPGATLDVTGNILLSGGGPTVRFNGGGPTISVPAASTLAIGTANTERMRLDSSGNVGIGTTAPASALQIGSTASGNSRIGGGSYSEYWITEAYPRVFLSRDGAASGVSALQFGVGAAPVDTTIQRLPSGPGVALMGGNVGIGTTSPAAALDVGGTGAVKIPVGTTAQRPGSPVTGMMRFNTDTLRVETYNGNSWGVYATGGMIAEVGGYRIHTFTGNGTFIVVSNGFVEVLVVGGGGGGGDRFGGGGGGGGLLHYNSYAVSPGNYPVVVGGGGAGGQTNDTRGSNGGNSSFDTLTALGGGGGASENTQPQSGGSGGGDSYSAVYAYSGAGTTGQGNAGGVGISSPRVNGGGGGAGAAGVGGSNIRPDGGVGLMYSISGTDTYYAGGGGGADNRVDSAGFGGPTAGNGGLGGGGQGGGGESNGQADSRSGNGLAGTVNTGGGGGGGSYIPSSATGRPGGNGGSGIVIIRYPI